MYKMQILKYGNVYGFICFRSRNPCLQLKAKVNKNNYAFRLTAGSKNIYQFFQSQINKTKSVRSGDTCSKAK